MPSPALAATRSFVRAPSRRRHAVAVRSNATTDSLRMRSSAVRIQVRRQYARLHDRAAAMSQALDRFRERRAELAFAHLETGLSAS
jgi:hypothetical protein